MKGEPCRVMCGVTGKQDWRVALRKSATTSGTKITQCSKQLSVCLKEAQCQKIGEIIS